MPMQAGPMVDPRTGFPTLIWWNWALAMFGRTGGGAGTGAKPPQPVTLGASPFEFTFPTLGTAVIAPPGMVRVELNNDGTWYPTGSWYGAFPAGGGAKLKLTYVAGPPIPSLIFIPQ